MRKGSTHLSELASSLLVLLAVQQRQGRRALELAGQHCVLLHTRVYTVIHHRAWQVNFESSVAEQEETTIFAGCVRDPDAGGVGREHKVKPTMHTDKVLTMHVLMLAETIIHMGLGRSDERRLTYVGLHASKQACRPGLLDDHAD